MNVGTILKKVQVSLLGTRKALINVIIVLGILTGNLSWLFIEH